MYCKIVFLLLILSSVTNSEENILDNSVINSNGTNETTEATAPSFEADVVTLPIETEPIKPVESKESETTPEDKKEPNPNPKPDEEKEEKKEEKKDEKKDDKKDEKPESKDPPKDESKKPEEMTEKPNENREPETPAPKQPEKASRTGLKKGSVWGIAIGVIGMVATTGFLVVYILKRRRGDDRLIR